MRTNSDVSNGCEFVAHLSLDRIAGFSPEPCSGIVLDVSPFSVQWVSRKRAAPCTFPARKLRYPLWPFCPVHAGGTAATRIGVRRLDVLRIIDVSNYRTVDLSMKRRTTDALSFGQKMREIEASHRNVKRGINCSRGRAEGSGYDPFCGSDLHPTPCKECGEAMEARWQFCVSCGTDIRG